MVDSQRATPTISSATLALLHAEEVELDLEDELPDDAAEELADPWDPDEPWLLFAELCGADEPWLLFAELCGADEPWLLFAELCGADEPWLLLESAELCDSDSVLD